MDKKFKWKVNDGEKLPPVNRVLNALVVAIMFHCIFFPVTGGWIWYCVWFSEHKLHSNVILSVGFSLLPLIVITFLSYRSDKYKPSSGVGTYRAGSMPNLNKLQSKKWYQHEHLMEHERYEERRKHKK